MLQARTKSQDWSPTLTTSSAEINKGREWLYHKDNFSTTACRQERCVQLLSKSCPSMIFLDTEMGYYTDKENEEPVLQEKTKRMWFV